MAAALLRVRHLKKYFPVKSGAVIKRKIGDVRAVDDVSFDVKPGETLGLVGESGCGKTTLGRCLLRLIEPTSGEIYFEGEDITKIKREALRKLRRNMQIVFQDPQSSLDPRMTVKDIVAEPLVIFHIASGDEIRRRVAELLQIVGLNPEHSNRFPHEFSGGQRQRIGIARALALNPKLVILDEPTSSLDVSVQAQILNLLKKLQHEMGLTYIFISHNLSVVRHMSDRIAVMYVGKFFETSPKTELFEKPLNPYTRALLAAIPVADPKLKRERIILSGDVPSSIFPPSGCRFHPRCPIAEPICSQSEPDLKEYIPSHSSACHFADRLIKEPSPLIGRG